MPVKSLLTFRLLPLLLCLCMCLCSLIVLAQEDSIVTSKKSIKKPGRTFYGLASFYANKFHGRQTANGEIFSQQKMTAACNVLPLGTWIQVTNLKNGKMVVVKTSDRLHPKMRRLVDLSKIAAQKLGYVGMGLTRVKVIVLDQKLYKKL